MKRFSRVLGILALVAIVSMALVPLALATRATPSVSLKAKPATVRVGKIVTFTGTVKNAVTKHDLRHGHILVHGQGGQGRNVHPQGHLPGRHGHLQESQGQGHYHQVSLCAAQRASRLTSPPVRRVEIP